MRTAEVILLVIKCVFYLTATGFVIKMWLKDKHNK